MRETMLIIHFVGLAMGLGTSLGFMFLGMASAKLEEAKAREFRINALALSRMGHIGLALLIISGLMLMGPYWDLLSDMPLLIGKLVLVVILGVFIGIISSNARKLKTGHPDANPAKIETFGKMALISALSIVVLAVLVFN